MLSGAAGTYLATLTEDANIGTDLVVEPGQQVLVSGDATAAAPDRPAWGRGAFSIRERGLLSLSDVRLESQLDVLPGARLILQAATVSGGIVLSDASADLTSCTLDDASFTQGKQHNYPQLSARFFSSQK